MARIQWTLCEADQEEYDLAGPRVFDTETLMDLRADELEAIEKELLAHAGITLFDLLAPVRETMSIVRAIMWVSLRVAGSSLGWEDFKPQTMRASIQPVDDGEDDADPLDGDSSPEG